MVKDAPVIETVLPEFLEFCRGSVLVAHNANFDYSFICKKGEEQGLDTEFTVVDTVGVARVLIPDMAKYTLDALAKRLKISLAVIMRFLPSLIAILWWINCRMARLL